MIDQIGNTPGTARTGRIESGEGKVVALAPVRAAPAAVTAETGARETAKAMAAKPPVDTDRVAQIKRALAEGRYPIIPAKIADRMIAAQLRWVEER